MVEQNPNASFAEIAKKLGEMWRDASPEAKELYEQKAAEDKVEQAPFLFSAP